MLSAGVPGQPPGWLTGLWAVMPTPWQADGTLDMASVDRVMEHYLAGGAAGLVPASIAGEGQLMTRAERHQLICRVVQRAAGRVPVMVGMLADSTDEALLQAQEAQALGVSGLLVKPPQAMSPQALQDHLGLLARRLHLPLVLIDHPQFGARLPTALIQQLARAIPELVGLKVEDLPTPAKIARLRGLLGDRLRLFGGLGGVQALAEMAQGADGMFTGYPQPQHLARLIACWQAGDTLGAQAAYQAALPGAQWEQAHPAQMVAQRKRILYELGVCRHAGVRSNASPLVAATPPHPRCASADAELQSA